MKFKEKKIQLNSKDADALNCKEIWKDLYDHNNKEDMIHGKYADDQNITTDQVDKKVHNNDVIKKILSMK